MPADPVSAAEPAFGPGSVPPAPPRAPSGPWTRLKAFLRRHPIVCLALLSPGIPEYLSSSSALSVLLVSPPFFALQLVANLGLYLPGVLLVREAMVRWRKGWGSVLLLGAAYGILEEGIALETLFYSRAGPVGSQGFYGHWLGVSWVWTTGILFVHMIFSISLPILLLGLALPETRGHELVGRRGVVAAFVVWAIDIPALMVVVHFAYHYWMGWPIFFGSLAAVGGLVWAAYRVPAHVLPTRTGPPRVSPRQAAVLGVAFFPPIWIIEALSLAWRLPPVAAIAALLAYEFGLGYLTIRRIGTVHNERQLVAFSGGILAVIAAIGFLAELPIPVTLVADVAAGWFVWHLWRTNRPAATSVPAQVPPGAIASA